MLPTMEDYRRYGARLGRDIAPVDWEGFSQMKRWDHGILPNLRRLAGYRDPMDRGTFTDPPEHLNVEVLDALVEGFRYGAETGESWE